MIPIDDRDEGTDPEDPSPSFFDEGFEDYELWDDDE